MSFTRPILRTSLPFPCFFSGTTGTLAKKPLQAPPLLALACPTRGGTLAFLAGTGWDTSPRVRRPATFGERRAGAGTCPDAWIFSAKFCPPAAYTGRFCRALLSLFTVWLAPLLFHCHTNEAAIVRRVPESSSRFVRVLLQIACYLLAALQNQAILQLFKINNCYINQYYKNMPPHFNGKNYRK